MAERRAKTAVRGRALIQPAAVLFDMDGVIVDSMPYHFISWYEALRPEGIRVTPLDVYRNEGEKWRVSMKRFAAAAGVPVTDGFIRRVYRRHELVFNTYFKRFIFGGTRELLKCLHGTARLALVTGNSQAGVRELLPRSIRNMFDAIVTADEVKHGKPHPEPYLTAARMLGIEPSRCVVIENAPLGVRAAKAAGMYCIALTTSLPREYLAGADLVLDTLGEIDGVIKRLCRPAFRHD